MLKNRGWLGLCSAAVLGLCGLSAAPDAHAAYGAADSAPGATLLIPYFEVDLANTNGRNTLVSITNTSATAVLGNVVLWSDQAIPVARFNIYLTGYDVQNFSLRDVLNGVLPRTATAGQDPTDTISPKGPASQDINFASCTTVLPPGATVTSFPGPSGTPPTVSDVRAMLTGAASTGLYAGQCVGSSRGDNVARGYVTIDTVNSCENRTPRDPNYFGFQVATPQPVLLGDFVLSDPSLSQMAVSPAVSLEASSSAPVAGAHTFYGSQVGFNGSDGREPLPTLYRPQADTNSSELLVWRDPKVVSQPHACGSAASFGALPVGDTNGVTAFGTESSPFAITGGAAIAPNATQRVPVNATPFTGLPTRKIAFFDIGLGHSPGVGFPLVDPGAAQSYIVTVRKPELSTIVNAKRFTLLQSATAMDTGLAPVRQHPGQ